MARTEATATGAPSGANAASTPVRPLRALWRGVVGGRSLHRQLLLWLLLPQLVLWLAAVAVTYNVAVRYANQGIDADLLRATRALARQVKPIDYGLLIDFPRAAQDVLEADPDDRYFYMVSTPPGQFILGSRKLPPPTPAGAPPLGVPIFYDGQLDAQRLRLAALYLSYGERPDQPGSHQVMLVQVARSQAGRDELARRVLLDTVLPLSVLIALMTMIVWAGIRAGLAPLLRLRRLVERHAPNDLAPLALDDAPQELRSLVGALNQLLAAVQANVVAQRRFIGHAAHQLRTPLAGLKSQTELALQAARGEGADPALAPRLQRVHDSAVRASHLINQLMALSRAEPEAAGALPHQRLDLRALVADVVADAVPQALAAGVDLGFDEGDAAAFAAAADAADADADDPDAGNDAHEAAVPTPAGAVAPITVDATALLLREAVANLIDNAVRYAGRGAEVTVAVKRDGALATVEVVDNGPGLSDEQREAVFGRFVRASSDGNGCGLGLAIVREIAERHGGSAALEAVSPHGVRALLRLPLPSAIADRRPASAH